MRMMPLIAVILLTALGCATHYYHPTKTSLEFEQDKRECERIARESLAAQGKDYS